MNYEHLKYGYTIDYVETMYAHYANLLHYGRNSANTFQIIYWQSRLNHYIAKHEEFYNFKWIAAQLPLKQINPKP